MDKKIRKIDAEIIHFFRYISEPVARVGLFVCFFWFGALKVFDLSPASPLVESLFNRTVPFMTFPVFMVLFGVYEMVIGLMFLFKGYEREVIPLLFAHMVTTFMPLLLLPETTWVSFMVPSLEGQYILKNFVIIAAAVGVAAHLHPLPRRVHKAR
ncbi:MAG TPA: hypothetical protein VGE62_00525 [Candidatus Paceibacterota bacterium]